MKTEPDTPAPTGRGRKMRRAARGLVLAAAAGLAVWWGGDLVYSRIVGARMARWEGTIERDAGGVRDGCAAWSLGEGRTAVLLIHGFGDSPAVYRRMGERLAAEGLAVRAMRLPGSAEPVDRMADATLADWRAAVDAELRDLRSSHDHVVVVGHSLGGTLALDHLLDAPGDADGLVLLAPLLRVSDARSPVLTAKAWFNVGRTVLRETEVVENFLPRDSTADAAQVADPSDRFIPRQVYENMFSLIADVEPRAEGFSLPLLVVIADGDEVVDGDAVERFFRACRSSDKLLLRATESGHMIPLDPGWEDVAEAIISLARRLEDAPGGSGGAAARAAPGGRSGG